MNKITKTIKNKYYIYQRGEFFPVYTNGELLNKKQFHMYKVKRVFKLVQYGIRQLQHQ